MGISFKVHPGKLFLTVLCVLLAKSLTQMVRHLGSTAPLCAMDTSKAVRWEYHYTSLLDCDKWVMDFADSDIAQ